ncbi:C40 family peptidase [Romboutsia sp.]|uniref:C40 family peptidase n=1 Tax=Romboutsia sp. TaxID=1965302 RepID=UPI003F2F532B
MGIKNNKTKILSKITMIALLTGCIYIGPINEEVYALPNENIVLRASTESGKVAPCDYLNVRSGPSANNGIVGKVYTGDSVEILQKDNNGWFKISKADSVTGWVNGKYITTENKNVNSSERQQVVDLAYKQIGKPYSWGSSGPNSFDCSGLTSYVYKNSVNVKLPRTSSDQSRFGKTVSKGQLEPGDLLFFGSGSNVSHVGVYVGDSKMVHSPSTGQTVRVDNINSGYYSNRLITAKRVL